MGVMFRLEMNLHDKFDNFEDLLLLNPMDKKSVEKCKKELSTRDFLMNVYPEDVIARFSSSVHNSNRGLHAPPPSMLFKPTRKLIRIMIQANLRWSSKESLEHFLLRFGMLDDPKWHMKQNAGK
jgi:hypothetical protein